MANMFGNKDWLKRAEEIYNETAPANSTDDYLNAIMNQYGIKPNEPDDTSLTGYLNSAKRGLVSGASGVGSGIAYLAGADGINKYLDDLAANNARKRDFNSIWSVDYATSPEGLTYDVANMGGSMAALFPAAYALPESAAGAGAGLAAKGLTKLGGQVGKWAAGKAGQEALKLGARGMVTAVPESLSEWGSTAQQAEAKGSESPRLDTVSDFAGNMVVLPFSNGLEYMTLGGKLFRPSAKIGEGLATRALKAPVRVLPSVAANATQNAGEELFQQTLSDNALGDPVGNPFNPYSWTDAQRQAFEVGLAGGGVLAGAGSGVRAMQSERSANAIERKAAEERPEIALRPAPIADGIEDFDLSKTDANLVGGVNDLNSWAYDNFGKDLIISGGYRNAEHNAAVNGSPTSYHLYGQALDVDASNFTEDERKQIEAKAREMGFNSNGENMYHDKGSGLHFHLILPEGNLASPFTTRGTPEAVDAESNSVYDELPAEVAARNAAEVEKQLDRISRGRGFVVDDVSELSRQQGMEDAAARKEMALSPVDAYLAEQERVRNETMAERWDEAAGRSGFMPQSYYDNPVDFYLNQRFIEMIEKAKRTNGKETVAAKIEVPKKYLNSDAAVRGLRGLERDTAEGIWQMYPDDLAKGWKQEQQRVQKRYDEMLEPALKELRSGMKQGVEVIRPDGEDKGYRASRNAPWYSDFYRQYKRPPTQAELRELAYEAMTGQRNILPGFENNSAESAAYFAEQKQAFDSMRSQLAAFDAIKSRLTGDKKENADTQLVTPGTYVQAVERAKSDLAGTKTALRREKLAERAVNSNVAIKATEGMLDGDAAATDTFNSYIPEVRSALLNKIGEERGYDSKTDEWREDQLQDAEFKQGEEDKGETGAQDENTETVNKKAAITEQEFKQQEANTSKIGNKGVEDNVTDSAEKLATGNGEVVAAENEVRENAGIRESAGGNGQRVRETESGGREGHIRTDSIHDSRTSVSRKSDDRGVQGAKSDDTTDSAGSAGLQGRIDDSRERQPDVNGEATGRAVKLAENGRADADAKRRELKNNSKNLKAESLRRVAKDLPFLTVGQVEDVVFAEKRLKDEAKTGVLFTNGTGTGKTFSGLGIAKELAEQGKNNILIVTPNDQINTQWVSAAKDYFDLMVTPLESIKDAGEGAVITTYANMQQNDAVVGRNWDLVIADESHNLMNNEKGETTGALQRLRAITFNKRGLYERAKVLLRTDEEKRLDKELDDLNRELRKDKDNVELDAKREKLQSKLRELSQEHAESDRKAIEEWQKIPDSEKPKTVFLSATPFAYDKDVDYAEGYLFNYPESDGSGYNSGDGREQFMMQHFGYSMRYNKLTRPDAQVDNRVMEVQFHEWLKKEGALSGRQLDIDKDYNRGFLLVGQGVGKNIDEGFNWLQDNHARYSSLRDFLTKQFNGRTRNYMIESIKAREVIPIVKEYLQQGKKVVLFHDTNKPRVLTHPFKISTEIFNRMAPEERSRVLREYEAFKRERPDLVNLNLASLNSPIEILQSAFGDELMLFNGDIPKNKRRENVREFNDDAGKKRLILVQADAGNAGISLHDTTGKHQRVLINLGIPKRPSYAIQIEGRIYRQGSMSNAIIRYLSTGMDVEKRLFAGTIASRASTAENLALGNEARGLRDSFVNAFMETMDGSWQQRRPGAEGEDVGGKEYDRATLSPLSDFERAKSLYFANQKKNAGNKAAEGKDYFATPEPVGFKMVEWAGLNDGDRVLEPSAGHGAISRFFSPNTENVIVEPSGKLAALAQMNTDGAKVVNGNFEDYNVVNKFNAVVMNPPFGVGGKTAMEHVAKAFKHLRDNGRIIAIVPDGPSMTKRFDQWYGSEEAANAYLVGEVLLPGEAFKRAGTGVYTKILVIDKHVSKDRVSVDSRQIDLRGAKNVNELFDRIENLSMPDRTAQAGSIKSVESKTPAVTATEPRQDSDLFETDIYTHTKTGENLYRAKIKERVSGDDYKKLSGYAKKYGGYYSRFAKGFLFDEEGSRDSFIDFVNNSAEIKYSVADKGEELNPIALDEWEAQAKDAFPNAKNFSRDGSVMEFDLPNGEHMRINVVDRVVLDDAEFERAQADYGGKLERDAEVLGSVRTIGKNAFMTLAQENVRGTIDHEALHYARTHGLTGRENAALERAFKGNEEAMAEAYRKWRIKWKELKEGSDWGKLWRKVKDFAAKVADFLGFETEHDVFRKIESGEVWERGNTVYKDSAAPNFSMGKSQIKRFIDAALQNKNEHLILRLGKVSKDEAEAIRKSTGLDVDGYTHVWESVDVRHIQNNHGVNTERNAEQVGLDQQDMLEALEAIEVPDEIKKGSPTRYGEPSIRFIKNGINGEYTVVEVVRKRNKRLAIKTMWKKAYKNKEEPSAKRHVDNIDPQYTSETGSRQVLASANNVSSKTDDVKYSILSKKDDKKQAEPKNLTSGQKAARAFTNTERKGTVKSAVDWMIDAKKNAYTNWIDKNDSLHGFDEAISMGLGRKLSDDESVYNKAQTMRANAAGLASALIEGDERSIEAINERLKSKKLPYKVTLAMVLDTVNRKVMDKRYPDYFQRNDFKNWADAVGTYLGCMRLREMAKIVRDAYAAELAAWRDNGSKGKRPEFKPYKLPGSLTEADLQAVIDGAPAEFRRAADLYYKFNDNLLTVMEDAGLISAEVHRLLNTKYKYYAPLMRDFSDTAAADNFIGGLQGLGRGIANVSSTLKKISIEGSERSVLNPLESTIKAVAVVASRAERNKVGQAAVALAGESELEGAVWKVPGSSADAKNCIFTVMEDGKKVAYQTTPELYGPIVGYNETSAGVVFGLLRNSARLLRSGATMSPSFILRNLIRDTLFAGISSKTGFIPVLDTVRGIHALLRDAKLRAEFEAAGVNKFNFYGSNEAIAKSLDDLIGGKDLKDYGAGDIWRALLKYPALLSELAESGTRMGEFMRARKQGISIDEAARYARELTLDFSRSGAQGEKVNQIVPFFNACLQGGDKMIRLLKHDSVNTMTALGKYIIAPSILLWCLNHDEDWYKELDPEIKNTCWCLPGGVRIPKPQEAGIFFGSGVEMILDMASNEDPAAMENFGRTFVANAAPNFLPTLFLPIIEWQANYSFFRDQPLTGKRLERLPDELQYNPGTSEVAKAIGSVTKWSPVKIDNTIRGYTGTMGMFLAQMFDPLVAEKRNMPTKKFGELTFIRDFTLNDNIKNRSVNDFYDMLAAANEQHAGYGVKGRPTAVVKNIRKAGELISKANKDIRNITTSTALSPDEKRARIDKRREYIRNIAKRANQLYGKYY